MDTPTRGVVDTGGSCSEEWDDDDVWKKDVRSRRTVASGTLQGWACPYGYTFTPNSSDRIWPTYVAARPWPFSGVNGAVDGVEDNEVVGSVEPMLSALVGTCGSGE